MFSYEDIMWKGEPSMLMTWIGYGDPTQTDAPASMLLSIFARDDLEKFYGTYISETGETLEYYEADAIRSVEVKPGGTTTPHELAIEYPMIDRLLFAQFLVLSGLEEGMKCRPACYSSGLDRVALPGYWVAGQETIEDAAGTSHQVWDVQMLGSLDGWISHYYVSEEAPYFINYEQRHAVTGEVSTRVRLVGMQRLN